MITFARNERFLRWLSLIFRGRFKSFTIVRKVLYDCAQSFTLLSTRAQLLLAVSPPPPNGIHDRGP